MSGEKLSSDVVPRKFTEWLLAMGCPQEKVPSVEKIAQMCRGQYYMVWRSLMERIQPKDAIRYKRLQVFCDDVRRCQKKNIFNECDTNVVIPEELLLWHQQLELKGKVADAEVRVAQIQQHLKQLMDKISSRMSHRNMSRHRVQELQRRTWLLQQVLEELRSKKANLQETRSIADSLCNIQEEVDVQDKLDKCISMLRRQGGHSPDNASLSQISGTNSILCPSAASTKTENTDSEEQLHSLMLCRGDAVWPQLYERRAALVAALAAANSRQTPDSPARNVSITPQTVLAHTAALHCSLALDTMKNRHHIKQTRKRVANDVSELNNSLSGECCELLVLRCERARGSGRVSALRTQLAELAAGDGAFAAAAAAAVVPPAEQHAPARLITTLDKAIESKKEELKKLVLYLSTTERKIQNVKECLITVFGSFQKDIPLNENDRCRGLQVDLPQESIASLQQFYEERRERRRSKIELSLDFDVSDCSFGDNIGSNAKFTDELKIYLKKFNLEKNRKLVLESGDKIWAFEMLESSLARLYAKWQSCDVPCSLLCPSVSLSHNIRRLIEEVQTRKILEAHSQTYSKGGNVTFTIDISTKIREEEEIVDKIKKRLNENILSLQKTNKSLELGQENLRFWSDNQIKKYISNARTVDGKTFKEYESLYLENLTLTV